MIAECYLYSLYTVECSNYLVGDSERYMEVAANTQLGEHEVNQIVLFHQFIIYRKSKTKQNKQTTIIGRFVPPTFLPGYSGHWHYSRVASVQFSYFCSSQSKRYLDDQLHLLTSEAYPLPKATAADIGEPLGRN